MQKLTCGLLLGTQLSVELLNALLQVSELRAVLLLVLLSFLHRAGSGFVTRQGDPPTLPAASTCTKDAAVILLTDARLMSPEALWGDPYLDRLHIRESSVSKVAIKLLCPVKADMYVR